MHSTSLGEAKSSLPIIENLIEKKLKIVVTTATKVGYDFIESYFENKITHIYAPFDTLWIVLKFLKHFKPKQYILIESDFWPNFIICFVNF